MGHHEEHGFSSLHNDPQGCRGGRDALSINIDQLEVKDESCWDESADAFSPGPQIDERSPDARVYRSNWHSDWTDTQLGDVPKRRTCLPEAAESTPSFNIWSIIKDFAGKDITHLSVPAYISEPTCELQRRAEGLQCVELLDQAATCPAYSRQRLLLVTAYAISIYSNLVRTTKPFKDLLHSTYELAYPEKGYRLIGEKVAHNPATTAMMCEGKGWRFLAYDESHLEFSLQCYIRLNSVGVMSVTFHDGDVYEWNQVPIYIQGLVIGPINLDHKGESQIICKATGNRTKLKLSCQGALSRVWRGNCHMVHGSLYENGQQVAGVEISGKWDQQISVRSGESLECLWRAATAEPKDPRYKLTSHAVELNELLVGMAAKLPSTDVRLRPDMRLLENGYPMKASILKDKLEDKQRNRRLLKVASTPQWFECIPPEKEGDLARWRYKGGYWEARESGQWPQMPDLYSLGSEEFKGSQDTGVVSVHARAAELIS